MTRAATRGAIAASLILASTLGGFAHGSAAAHAQRTSETSTFETWTSDELATLRTLSLDAAGPLPPDPSNRVADNAAAAALGRRLFFDTRLSANGKIACSSCHLPAKHFQDGLPLGKGIGTTARRTMTIVGTAYSPWFFWDGRADSQWSQALGPLESAAEHGGTRTQYVRLLAEDYKNSYEALFGPLPSTESLPRSAAPNGTASERAAWASLSSAQRDSITRAFANIGKSIAAFERGLRFTPTRFDRYVASLDRPAPERERARLSTTEIAGLKLFIGAAKCVTCHSGPLFTDNHFHNVGLPLPAAAYDSGRASGIKQALASEFNCIGPYSDATRSQCAELTFAITEGPELVQAFRTPSLRGVAQRAPYGHDGTLRTLAAVLDHYDRAPAAQLGHTELEPLRLTPAQRRQLEAFLRALSGE